jgi:hypothetical protein
MKLWRFIQTMLFRIWSKRSVKRSVVIQIYTKMKQGAKQRITGGREEGSSKSLKHIIIIS